MKVPRLAAIHVLNLAMLEMAEQKKTAKATVRSALALAAAVSVRRALAQEVQRGREGEDRAGKLARGEHDRRVVPVGQVLNT